VHVGTLAINSGNQL